MYIKHHKTARGYAALYLGLVFIFLLLTGVLCLGAYFLSIGSIGTLANLGVFLSVFIAAFMSMKRFLRIEGRRPDLYEANVIGVWAIAYFLFILLIIALIGLVFFVFFKIIQSGEPPKPPIETLDGDEKGDMLRNAAIWGGLGTLLFLYLSPLLNFALLALLNKVPVPDENSAKT